MRSFLLLAVGLALSGCLATPPRGGGPPTPQNVPTTAVLGPYRLHLEADGTLRLSRGSDLLYRHNDRTQILYDGRLPLFEYAADPGKPLRAAYLVHIRDAEGKVAFTLSDEDADGRFDRKIDYGTGEVYRWVNGGWTR